MKNTEIAGALVLAIVLGAPLPVYTQPAKVVRIGVLTPGSLVTPGTLTNSVYEPFRQGLRELGYVEGQNIVVEVRAAEGEELKRIAAAIPHDAGERYPAGAMKLVNL